MRNIPLRLCNSFQHLQSDEALFVCVESFRRGTLRIVTKSGVGFSLEGENAVAVLRGKSGLGGIMSQVALNASGTLERAFTRRWLCLQMYNAIGCLRVCSAIHGSMSKVSKILKAPKRTHDIGLLSDC